MSFFICTSIRSQTKVLKLWFARSVLYGKMTLTDLFTEFASGDLDGGVVLGEQYQTAEVGCCMTKEHCCFS